MDWTVATFWGFLPLIFPLAGAVALLLFESVSAGRGRSYYTPVSITVLLSGLGFALLNSSAEVVRLGGAEKPFLILDAYSRVVVSLLLGIGAVSLLLAAQFSKNRLKHPGEYHALLLFAVCGMSIMAAAADLMTLFLGLETMSLALYVMVGLRRHDVRGSESALKYFLLGALAASVLVFGMALLFGATGSLSYADIGTRVIESHKTMSLVGGLLVLIGFAFKLAAVPFHAWAPDVYEGAPTPVAGFMAAGVKVAVASALLRILTEVAPSAWLPVWTNFLSFLAIASIVFGNVLALVQPTVKRMLAYSSIGHAGYLLVGLVAASRGAQEASTALVFYLSVYALMALGAFGVLAALEQENGGPLMERTNTYAGIGFRYPVLGATFALFLLSLAGLPPTGGFVAKFLVFSAALSAGRLDLALVGIAGSLLGVYYYLRVVAVLYMKSRTEPGPIMRLHRSNRLIAGLLASAVVVIVLGLWPERWLQRMELAAAALKSAETYGTHR